MSVRGRYLAAALLALPALVWCVQKAAVMLPNGWLVSPAGVRNVNLGCMPIRLLPDPSGRWLITQQGNFTEGGAGQGHALLVLDARSGEIAHRLPLAGVYHGMAFADSGRTLFVSGGVTGKVYRFAFDPGTGTPQLQVELSMAGTSQGGSFTHGDFKPFVGGVALSADGSTVYATAMDEHHALARDAKLGVAKWTTSVARFPYEIVRHPARGKLYVTSWMTSDVEVLQESSGRRLATVRVGRHPNAAVLSPDGRTLYVACSQTNDVFAIDTESDRARNRIDVGLYPDAPAGSTPVGLTLTADGRHLLVANADNNAVMIVDTARSSVIGAIPTGWYPTDVALSADNRSVYIVSGLGGGAWLADFNFPTRPFDPKGARPEQKRSYFEQYNGQQDALLQIVPFPSPGAAAAGLEEVRRNSPYRPEKLRRNVKLPPIRNVIYIIRENKTYDSILGDNPRGNGDATLALFGRKITPNAHRLADDFVLLDNFFLEEGGSATGHQYINSGYVGDHIRRFPRWHGPKQRPSIPDDKPPLGYLWDHAIAHGVSVRNYWEGMREGQDGKEEADSDDPELEGFTVSKYIDRYFDGLKAAEWIREFRQFEASGALPRFQVVFLGQDHTSGTTPFQKTPNADVAENDYAVARIVETLSHSRYWKETVVFVIQDDAGQLPDHVSAARSVCLLAGGYVRRGYVDHTRYSVASVLATIEAILGLPPMTQFDAAAPLMTGLFASEPDLRPWKATSPLVDIEERNTPASVAARRSARLDRSDIDRDNAGFACVLWEYVKGVDLCAQKSGAEGSGRYDQMFRLRRPGHAEAEAAAAAR